MNGSILFKETTEQATETMALALEQQQLLQ